MKVYFFDASTKEFVAEGNAFTDPRASERLGKDVWLLPANATFDEPLQAKDGYKVVYKDGWVYEEIPQPKKEQEMLTTEEKARKKRLERNFRLSESDKVMLVDYPVNSEEKEFYKKYRQYLRDLPTNENFPNLEVLSFEEWYGA